ncbi:ATP-binding protein [Xanthobacteraceae bacterium A53D]
MATAIDDTSGNKNLYLLIQLRWLAVAGQVFTILVVEVWLHIPLPLREMGAVLLFLVLLNLVALWRHRNSEEVTNVELFFELSLDIAALTILLYLSGGATNPFISLYLLQVGLGAVLLQNWSAWVLVLMTGGGFVWLTTTFRPLTLPEEHRAGLFDLHIAGMFVCFLLAATLLVQFISRINANLRERDAHLADLRQTSAEEDHVVRIGLLASGAAHELGTPLATLSVILNDWRHMPELAEDPDLAEEMAEMQSQLDRCKAIVSGILMSSGEARGEGTFRTTACAFFDDLVAEWRGSRSPRTLGYNNTLSPDAPIISDTALKQVIFNILDNALEASPDWVGVSVQRQGDLLVLVVRDHGPGFDEAILAEFGKPYRSTKGRPGSGLGLFLVVNVVRKLGGSVKAFNEPSGARVVLQLPLPALSPDDPHGA